MSNHVFAYRRITSICFLFTALFTLAGCGGGGGGRSCDINAVDNAGWSPLHLAVRAADSRLQSIAARLLTDVRLDINLLKLLSPKRRENS